ncbi:unnamed protein product [Rhizoctonia solani]|uniref:Chromo domain-containing protein n=1 Tax=Rhizoctonia solani TaxID=456999 RepID=A0A8H2XXM5_9AGAM|nr:unnamed protein product [Rhizoctonia solani]
MSQYPAASYETQFEAHSDDEEHLFNVERILAEKGRKYLVQWEGLDPTTGEKWAPDWVPKTDCTDDLITDWKLEKARMKQKGKGTSIKSASSVSGSVPPRSSKSRSVSGRSMAPRVTEASTSARSRSPPPLPQNTTTSRRQSAFYIELPAPRRAKRLRESDPKPEPMSPVKRMKLGGPASPLPASPFDNDDGGVGAMFPKKRNGPVTYKNRRKPQVIKSPSFPKLTGPYVREQNVAESSRNRGPTYPEPTKRRAEGEEDADDANTDTETEDESPPAPPKPRVDRQTSPLKSKSEPLLRPRTRNATRNAPSEPEPEPERASSVPFERPHPTSAARTRSLPNRSASAQREIKRQILLGLPGLPEDYPRWPRVVGRDETRHRRSDPKSRASIVTDTSRKSADGTSIAGPSVLPEAKAAPVPEADEPLPASPPPVHSPPPVFSPLLVPTPSPLSPNPSPEALPKRSSLAKSTAGSSGRPSSAKSVSFRVEGVDDIDEYQDDYAPIIPDEREAHSERVMSSVESENEPVSHDPTQQLVPIEQPQSQSRSNSDSSKSTHISDSQDGTEEGERRSADFGDIVENEVEESEAEVENPELALHGPEEEEGGSEEDRDEDQEVDAVEDREEDQGDSQEDSQEDDQEDDQEEEQEGDHDEIQGREEVPMHSSPSLGGDVPELPPEPDVDMGSPGRELSPPADIQPDESLDLGGAGDMDEVRGVEQVHVPEGPSEETDGDASMAHATEVDMLLSSDISQRSEPDDELEEEDSAPATGDSTIDIPKSTAGDTRQEHRVGEPADSTQALTDSSSGRVAAPELRTAIDHPTTREVISTLLPGILDTPSQSQSQSHSLTTETQDHSLIPPTLPAQIIANVLTQPDVVPAPQHSQSQQENTHSSIEEPASSWNIPLPGQLPPQNDTISNFTPTNPSIKPSPAVPSPDGEQIFPSGLADGMNGHSGVTVPANQEPSQVNGTELSQETRHDHSSALSFPVSSRSSELGAVPEMSLEVFKKHTRSTSPGSEIGEFSPRKSSPRPSPQSSERASIRPYQQNLSHRSSPSPGDAWNKARRTGRSSLHSSPSFRYSTGGDTGKQIQEQATRIQSLLADLANLEAARKAAETEASAFVESINRLNEVIQQERDEHAEAIGMQSAAILDLEKQLEVVRNQYETAESQREFALEQYTRASTEAKRMSDENRVLETKVAKLERQLNSGLRQWQIGFESNVARHQQEVQTLKGQLALEREMYTRSKAPELCRRAAEWYELKKQIKELEEDAAEAERREALLRDREIDIRRREMAIADREQALEDSVRATQSQVQTSQRLSQDDLQTETMLSDGSAVLAGLDGDLGEELVWVCSYRESTGKICGKVFDSMGMLLTHVLDADGHKVESACDCAQAS